MGSLDRIFSATELENLKRNAFEWDDTVYSWREISEKGLVVYGAGHAGIEMLELLLEHGVQPEWMVDRNSALYGTNNHGVIVRPKESLSEASGKFVLLAGAYWHEFYVECMRYPLCFCILPANLPEEILVHSSMLQHYDQLDATEEFFSLYEQLADQKSKDMLKRLLTYKIIGDTKVFCNDIREDEYFPRGLCGQIDYSKFCEAGTFTGNTMRRWAGYVQEHALKDPSYYGFEPSPPTFKLVCKAVASLPVALRSHVHLFNKGLGAQRLRLSLIGTNEIATFTQSDAIDKNMADIIRLDDVPNIELTCFAVDTEGYEFECLEGAQQLIRSQHPTLAISVYHKKDDIFKLPTLIKSIDPKYKIYLRHHSPAFEDVVCYAI